MRVSASKHLVLLADANLITTVWRGREKLHFLNAEPINASGLEIEHADQLILESDPNRMLAFTFHTFVPELATLELDEEVITKAAAERRSKVSFDIEPIVDDQVKRTVVHADLPTEGTVRQLISDG